MALKVSHRPAVSRISGFKWLKNCVLLKTFLRNKRLYIH